VIGSDGQAAGEAELKSRRGRSSRAAAGRAVLRWPIAAGRETGFGDVIGEVLSVCRLPVSDVRAPCAEQADVVLAAPGRELAQVQRLRLAGQAGITGKRQALRPGEHRRCRSQRSRGGGCGDDGPCAALSSRSFSNATQMTMNNCVRPSRQPGPGMERRVVRRRGSSASARRTPPASRHRRRGVP
jgi:hypothetical protein